MLAYIHVYARACAFHIPIHIAFLLLVRAFAHVLVSPAINNMEDVLYIVAGQYMNPYPIDLGNINHLLFHNHNLYLRNYHLYPTSNLIKSSTNHIW